MRDVDKGSEGMMVGMKYGKVGWGFEMGTRNKIWDEGGVDTGHP